MLFPELQQYMYFNCASYLKNVAFFLISSMVLGLTDQLQIFWQLYLIEFLGVLTGLGLLEL